MAPNKKKKAKVASNPARGFATVSVASKVKLPEADSQAASGIATEAVENGTVGPPRPWATTDQANHDSESATAIKDMSPEELESHLDDCELQSLLDASSAACKADVSRQLTRLHAERRQLRAQAFKLNMRACLDEGTVDSVLLTPGKSSQRPRGATTIFTGYSSRRLLDLWTLQRVLTALKMGRIPDAIAHVVLLGFQGLVSEDSHLIWGLVEAFDWYAQYGSGEELPDYDATRKEEGRPFGEDDLPSPTDPENTAPTNLEQREETQMEADAQNTSSTDSEVISDDDDPDKLVAKYLRLKQKLWKTQNRTHAQKRDNNLRLRKLQNRVSSIERDILFDRDSAQSQWLSIEIELQAEKGRRRRATTETREKTELNAKDVDIPQHSDHTPDTEAADELFGDMFIAPGEDLHEAQVSGTASKGVRLVNFGYWSGLSPRQLLQQMSRTIDSKATLKTLALSQSTYSARHRIILTWSTIRSPESFDIAALPDEISVTIRARQWTIDMAAIAASNTEQSVAYVSTLMLFLVLSQEGHEHQSLIRLPTIWRDEFAKLANRRKSLINERDKAELRELRKVIKEQEDGYSLETSILSQQEGFTTTKQSVTAIRPNPTDGYKDDHFSSMKIWEARECSPAYQKMQKIREKLPIFIHKDLILESIAGNPITIICAETGSGKSTQTGSYILERELSQGRECRILVTQPRRISAVSLARRVSIELGESMNDLGTLRSLVGYAIRLESRISASTRLTFATTGVLLRMLESSPNLEQLDYLILDEVHERTIEMDLLFIVLRRLQQRRPGLKIILMSATVDARKFSDYFGKAPILDIPGRTFPVEVQFLEDAVEETNSIKSASRSVVEQNELSEEEGDASRTNSPSVLTYLENYSPATRKRLNNMDEYRIDYDLITRLATAIATKTKFAKYSSAILVFMPGIAEIRRLNNAVLSTDCFGDGWDVHMLHSSFSTEDLERAFAIPLRGRRKIVIATNIAETGITIPDVTAVIDTCKEKIMRFDERRQLSKLTESFVSRSSAKQRRGRAARVQEGLCFHLVTRHRYNNQMLEQQVPEMMRLSLQDPILRVKIWNMGTIEDIFQAALDPPSAKNIVRATERLKDAGALTKSEQLTALGQRIARLPLDVTFAKLAILAAIFQCVDQVLGMISILTSKSIFLVSAGTDPRTAFGRADSDVLSSLAAYEGWKKARIASKSAEFCRKNHLSEQNLLQVEDQKVQLLVYLVDGGLVWLDADEKGTLSKARVSSARRKDFYHFPQRYNEKVGDDLLLSLTAMAFYPRTLIREGNGWRNVYTNQQVSLRKESVNHRASRPPRWLSFSEAMQTKMGRLNVFETSRIPDVALALLLGDADVKMFAGVAVLDGGRVKLAVRHWRQALALKHSRRGIGDMLERRYRRPEEPMSETDRYWIEMLKALTQA